MAGMGVNEGNYRRLDAEKIEQTTARLKARIEERLPASGLTKVAQALLDISHETVERSTWIARPIYSIRLLQALLIAGFVATLAILPTSLHRFGEVKTVVDFIQLLEPVLGSTFFVAAILYALVSLETRAKRNRALKSLHELRTMAHLVDMHQLSKAPEQLLGESTASSPKRSMTPFQLQRYLNYCSELLALISKIAALYVIDFPDSVATQAVDEIENLTSSLSRKIWQKIQLLELNGSQFASIATSEPN